MIYLKTPKSIEMINNQYLYLSNNYKNYNLNLSKEINFLYNERETIQKENNEISNRKKRIRK